MNDTFTVAVLMEKRPPANQWADAYWKAVGIIMGEQTDNETRLVHEQGAVQQYMIPGFTIRLYKDQCESYYHNMKSPQPGCYIICYKHDNAMPEPFLISMSFDEAHSYLEGDEEIYSVPVPPELYQHTEAFVIANYFPEKKKKRKLNNWKQGGGNIRA
ncbi:MAG: DUF3305 domain-containing protein [Thiolinea sp.]